MMRPDLVVLSEPDIDCDLGLPSAVEPLGIENLPAQCSVETFVVAILPWATWIDLHWLDADLFQPALERRSNELRAIIRTDELRLAVLHQQPVQHIQNIVSIHLGSHCHAQSLAAVLVQHRQHLIAAPVAQLVMYEIDGPDVVGVRRAQPDDRAVFVIEPPSLLMTVRQL